MATPSESRSPRMGLKAALPPLRRSRNVIGEQLGPAAAVGSDGPREDERKPASGARAGPAGTPGTRQAAEPLVLAPECPPVLAELLPEARRARTVALPICPDCRSFVDAPRPAPSGRLDRWCRVCLRWGSEPGRNASAPAAGDLVQEQP